MKYDVICGSKYEQITKDAESTCFIMNQIEDFKIKYKL